eukprot:TRINITY_DN2025_c0_g1_i1.p1 TRINITY_DN2025_c0_g1~~TRINITY_DN2025_c0_g1_i1.p1  ORF type:complete len:202 (-),score=23.60 TRINITY_DN2025_c0_g1_i1:103-708(-)
MDNVTLFKKIFSDGERFMKPFRNYLDKDAMHPKLSCNKEDLKKYRFIKESLNNTLTSLCLCEEQNPDVAKAAYDCFKKYENDDYTLLKCEKPLEELNNTVRSTINKLQDDNERFRQIKTICSDQYKDFAEDTSDETAAYFHACFMPVFCTAPMKRALNCVNKNNEELHGCEKEIDEMLKCSIDKYHQNNFKTMNFRTDDEN